jgi:hypothetical protein
MTDRPMQWMKAGGVFDRIDRMNGIGKIRYPAHPVKKRLPLRSRGPEGRPILARPVRAGSPSAASVKPHRGGTRMRRWITRLCRPYGALRVASRCTGADAPVYNVSPLRGWGVPIRTVNAGRMPASRNPPS